VPQKTTKDFLKVFNKKFENLDKKSIDDILKNVINVSRIKFFELKIFQQARSGCKSVIQLLV
jgi:hypothetical protein